MRSSAIVIGAGVAGLTAAAALSRHVADVVVLEQDALEGRRAGVPQIRQLHNLLGRAQLHLDELLPGFADAAIARGANKAEVASETHVVEYGRRMPLRALGLSLIGATPPQVESALRQLLPPNVAIKQGARVTGLQGDSKRVTGVRVGPEVILADVVVDASGAATRADEWLAELRVRLPRREVTPVNRWYVTMSVRRPASYEGDPAFWLFFPTSPATSGCLVSPLDAQAWLVSASGGEADEVPRDLGGFRRHAQRLDDDGIANALEAATGVGSPALFRRQTVRWRRYDELNAPPEGFLASGDAVAALNPLLGQGISVAAWQASLLAESLPADAHTHHERVCAPVRAALGLTTLDTAPVADGRGRVISGDRYFAALARAVRDDESLHRDYVRMWHLLTPSDVLRSPPVVDRVMALDDLTQEVS